MKNQRDENVLKHGLWEWYHSNGELWYKGSYKHGLLHGLWKSYHPGGRSCYKGAFKRGIQVGLCYNPSI